MIIVFSVNEIPIRLTTERWEHILRRHPEMESEKVKVLETVENPDFIQEGDYGTLVAVKFYDETLLTSKYLIVIYREIDKTDGFILTSYFTNKPNEKKKTTWKP